MRLQDKKQVAASLATQRKADIDKGIALATKVDAVRATLSKEEKDLADFRRNSIAYVQNEIDAKLRHKASLLVEIKVLEEERQRLSEPLDKEWHAVVTEKTLLAKKENELSEKSFVLNQKLEEVDRELAEVETEKGRIADMSHRAAQKLAEAQTSVDNAHESAADMRNQAQITLSTAELKLKEVDKKELESDNRAKIVSMKEANLVKRELAVIDGERRIRDGYATLLRTTKRTHG